MADQDSNQSKTATSYVAANYKGFVAGVFSGISKLAGKKPYDWFGSSHEVAVL